MKNAHFEDVQVKVDEKEFFLITLLLSKETRANEREVGALRKSDDSPICRPIP